MSVEFACHNCGRELKVQEQAIGRRVRCPECATLVVVPNPADLKAEQEPEDLSAESSPAEEELEEPVQDITPAALPEMEVSEPPEEPHEVRERRRARTIARR